jgi:hypothetical protein
MQRWKHPTLRLVAWPFGAHHNIRTAFTAPRSLVTSRRQRSRDLLVTADLRCMPLHTREPHALSAAIERAARKDKSARRHMLLSTLAFLALPKPGPSFTSATPVHRGSRLRGSVRSSLATDLGTCLDIAEIQPLHVAQTQYIGL